MDYLYTHAREHLMLNLPQNFFEDALGSGRCVVCLDGLDEVWSPDQRKTVRDRVVALTNLYPRCRYVVTSRIVGYGEAPLDRRAFAHYTILPFEDDDIRAFVEKWYGLREGDPKKRRDQIKNLTDTIMREPRIKDLARNPLLLTIIALVHRIEAELPHERVKLYEKCVTALVETWEGVKGLTIEEKQRPFYHRRRRLLERLAYQLHAGGEEPGKLQAIKEGDLELLLTRFLMESGWLGSRQDPDGARDEARAFVRLARGRTGLLVERGEALFAFPHLSFQDYLAACDIEKRCMRRGVAAIWSEIKDHLHEAHWREVILLLLGSLGKYDEAPTLLVERILEAGESDKFEPLVHRHLYLAAYALADRVDVTDDLYSRVITAVLEVARTGHSWSFNRLLLEPLGEAADAIATISGMKGDRRSNEALLGLVLDSHSEAWGRCKAASALGELGHVGDKVLDGLLGLARNEEVEVEVRCHTASVLGQLGRAEEAADVLLSLATGEEVGIWVRYLAASALGQLSRADEATVILRGLVRDRKASHWLRREIVSILVQLGRAEEAIVLLRSLTWDENVEDDVRCEAASALGQLGRAEEAYEALLALASDDKEVSDRVRYLAASAIGQLDRVDDATRLLRGLVRDENVEDDVRCEAASALGQFGRAEEGAELLRGLARDENVEDDVRCEAASALGQFGRAEEGAELLLGLARDENVEDDVRRSALFALVELGCAEEKILDGLLGLARDEKAPDVVRSLAAYALGHLGRAEEGAEILLGLVLDEKVENMVRFSLLPLWGNLGERRKGLRFC
ncbi:MAG: tetratricopeptide repeat protein [Chloroflexota bacterium]